MTTIPPRPMVPGYLRRAPARFLDWLLGPHCPSCRDRVFAKDQLRHTYIDHAGDDTWNRGGDDQ